MQDSLSCSLYRQSNQQSVHVYKCNNLCVLQCVYVCLCIKTHTLKLFATNNLSHPRVLATPPGSNQSESFTGVFLGNHQHPRVKVYTAHRDGGCTGWNICPGQSGITYTVTNLCIANIAYSCFQPSWAMSVHCWKAIHGYKISVGEITRPLACDRMLTCRYTRSKKFSPKNKKDLGMACHTPPLKKVKKQGEMPLPSLSPMQLKKCRTTLQHTSSWISTTPA